MRMRSAYVLMLFTPTLASSAKNTKICADAHTPPLQFLVLEVLQKV